MIGSIRKCGLRPRKWDYELAAQKRDALRDVEGLMERQRAIQTNDAQQDVLALAQDGLDAMAQVLIIRGGRMIGGDSFALPGEGNEPPQSVLTEFALRSTMPISVCPHAKS